MPISIREIQSRIDPFPRVYCSDEAMDDAEEIREAYQHKVDLVIDGGYCGIEPTTVISLIDSVPEIMRHGKGDVGFLEG